MITFTDSQGKICLFSPKHGVEGSFWSLSTSLEYWLERDFSQHLPTLKSAVFAFYYTAVQIKMPCLLYTLNAVLCCSAQFKGTHGTRIPSRNKETKLICEYSFKQAQSLTSPGYSSQLPFFLNDVFVHCVFGKQQLLPQNTQKLGAKVRKKKTQHYSISLL